MDSRRLLFLDETGAKTNMTCGYGHGKKGERVVDCVPHGHWNTTTLVAAMSREKVVAPMVLDGPMDGLRFEAYVEQILIPALPREAIVVMDNLASHKAPSIAQHLNDAGIHWNYLPPYSSDFGPIEQMWSKVKSHLRSAKARTQEGLLQAIAEALPRIRPSDTEGFFLNSCVGIKS